MKNIKCECKYPGCKKSAVTTYALVPICATHYSDIYNETLNYYKKKVTSNNTKYSDREHYHKISHLTLLANKEEMQ
ncbi:hypothetical protein M948_18160 [Virgibacillus sp. CM-4]|nr:hypothetical protein M948_18160 [Virgibacillus sp. CM-4]